MFKGIFFDLGGTLVSYHNVNRTHAPLLLETAERIGIGAEPHAVKSAYAQAAEEITQAYASKDYYLHRDFFFETIARCCQLLGAAITPAVETWYQHEHMSRL
ncbi:MAG: hypothetical protein ACREXT_05485, partial [Gammaproteobacteria bacterium]